MILYFLLVLFGFTNIFAIESFETDKKNDIISSPSNIKNNNLKKVSIEIDTSFIPNKISLIYNKNQIYYVKLLITQFKDRPFRLSLVNLIGKEVKLIYEGYPKDNEWEYTFSYSEIPNGVYICVLSSSDYRDAKKIVISK